MDDTLYCRDAPTVMKPELYAGQINPLGFKHYSPALIEVIEGKD